VAAGAATVALTLSAGVAGGYLAHRLDTAGAPATTVTARATGVSGRSSLATIAAAVQPGVVSISTGSAEGSGVVVRGDGYVLTNNHVVSTAQGRGITLTFADGKVVTASIVGTDPTTDLAVVRTTGTSALTAATFGNSQQVQVGDTVLAIGSPLGLQGTVTAGIVSALHRDLNAGQRTGTGTATITDAIQTDAAINPGNSGGALVNNAGQVIGINTAIATAGQGEGNIGVGFAIPGNTAKRVADRIIATQR
jgi:putative serine protease PepD